MLIAHVSCKNLRTSDQTLIQHMMMIAKYKLRPCSSFERVPEIWLLNLCVGKVKYSIP